MRLYTIDGKSHNFSFDSSTKEGTYGNINLTKNNKCLKLFKTEVSRKDKKDFDEEIYNEIRKLNLENYYVLYDLYYNQALTKILGYLSEYYQAEDIDILTMPIDYTLNNLCTLYRSLSILAENYIRTDDLHKDNIITQKDKIIVIDTDLYYKDSKSAKEEILKQNIYDLRDLFIEIYLTSLNNYQGKERFRMAEKVFRLFTINSTFGVDPVIKKLIKYKYPIDYLRKK